MKVTVKENKKNDDKYPCLMELNGHIVLFYRYGAGTKLVKPKNMSGSEVGEWSDEFSMTGYTLFTGSITLEND